MSGKAAAQPEPSISLVTVTFNSQDTLNEFWGGARELDAEWIVVDNASTDGSVSVARELGARVISSPVNAGFSAANNLGARVSESDVLIFCNPDVRTTQDGIKSLARAAVEHQALVAPQLINVDGSLQENGRGTPFPHRKVQHMFGNQHRQHRYVRFAQPGDLRQVVWVMGAAVAMTRESFNRIGGWDAGFFIYYEDADISIRALREGIPTLLDGDTQWQHGWSRETRSKPSLRAWLYEFRSAARFYRRHAYCVLPFGSSAKRLRAVDRLPNGSRVR